jgi:hypothetical protein
LLPSLNEKYKLIFKHQKLVFTFIALLYLGILYIPLIMHGGIIVDDWGNIGQDLYCANLLDCYLGWFPLFANRPLAPIPIVITTMSFGLSFYAYLIINSLVYLMSIGILSWQLRHFLGLRESQFFFFIAAIPIIAMPIVVSPINCLVNNTSLLLWVLSVLTLIRYCQTGSLIFYISSYCFLLMCLLTYEIILPFLVFNASLPYLLDKNRKRLFPYCITYLLPLGIVLCFIVLWQKAFAPELFSIVYSRIGFSWERTYWGMEGWASIFSDKLLNLFIKEWKISKALVLISCFSVVLLNLTIRYSQRDQTLTSYRKDYKFLFICLLIFLSCYVIFSLGGAKEISVGGYDARILSSTWLSFSLLLAAVLSVLYGLFKRLFNLALILLMGFSVAAFVLQRNNYIASWELQQRIINNIVQLVKDNNISQPISVIGDVPLYLNTNFNNEIVFSTPWDLGFALKIYSDGLISSAAPIDTSRGVINGMKLVDQGVLIENYWEGIPPNLWVYTYYPSKGSGDLIHINSRVQLNSWLMSIGYLGELGTTSAVEMNHKIDFGKNLFGRNQIMKSGWYSEIEPWGGIWSTNLWSELNLPMPKIRPNSIEFTGNAFVSPAHPKQSVEIFIGERLEKVVDLKSEKNNTFSIPIPTSALGSPILTIKFHFVDAISPKELGLGDDQRKLAFGIKEAIFR